MILVLSNVTLDGIQSIYDHIDKTYPPMKGVSYLHNGKSKPVPDAVIIRKHVEMNETVGLYQVTISLADRKVIWRGFDKCVSPLSCNTFREFLDFSETLFQREERVGCP